MRPFESATSPAWTLLLCFVGLFNDQMVLAWGRQEVVHGWWSAWGRWSPCSRTCGGGMRERARGCLLTNRVVRSQVSSGNCPGEAIDRELCSTHACADSDGSLAFQCSQKNGKRRGEWIPHIHRKNPCELQCWPKDRSQLHSFGKVADGTPCPPTNHESAVCVNGRCTPVDCAGGVGRRERGARRDRCGVCRGNNSTCVRYHDTLWGRPRYNSRERQGHPQYEYASILSIPAGASNIAVSEKSDTNFLVLVDHAGQYVVNGDRRVQPPGLVWVHGTEFAYTRTPDGHENLSSSGPTTHPLKLMVLGYGDIPAVQYEYWISTHRITPQHSSSEPPFNNSIQTHTAHAKVFPVTKFRSYNSYYHRNEILKSVPSWSIKRHRSHPHHMTFDTSRSRGWNGTNLRQLESSGRGATVPATVTAENYQIRRSRDFGRPNGTSAFTRYSHADRDDEGTLVKKGGTWTRPTKLKIHRIEDRRPKRKRKSDNGQCPPCTRVKQQTKNFCKSDFVIRATLLSSERLPQGTRLELEVVRSYKNTVGMLAREYVWRTEEDSDTTCPPCPRLRTGREYVLMGRVEQGGRGRESRLAVGRGSFVRPYSEKRARTLLRLARDQRAVCARY